MKKINSNKQGFSIVVAVFMIGFLLVLTTGVFNMVLREMIDNRGSENSLKAYAGAEGAMELGLLGIKENGYGFDSDLISTQSGAESLTFSPDFKTQSDPKISYDMDVATGSLVAVGIESGETVLIPLFSNSQGVKKPTFTTSSADILWNIVGNGEGMSGSGSFAPLTSQVYKENTGLYSTSPKSINEFLTKIGNDKSYLMLFNKGTSATTFNLSVLAGELFSKPVGNITSSVTVGKYKQNISTSIDNTEFLNMLKYSLYAN